MLSKTKACSFLSEFTDFILQDEKRGSIVVAVQEEYVKIVCYELRKFNYNLIHKTKTGGQGSFTLVFMLVD